MWRGYSVYTSGYHSVDRLSDIDEFEESFKMGTNNHPATPIRSSGTASLQDSVDNLSLDTGDLLGEDYSVGDDVEEEVEDVDGVVEEEEDEDSTPHIMSETSKTQSPISTEKVSLERQLEEPLEEEEDEVIEDFNQGERGKSLAEELALQIELESDKSRLQGEGGGAGVEGNLLEPEELAGSQFWSDKISQQTSQHQLKADLSGEDTSPARSLQTKTDFGIVSGKF